MKNRIASISRKTKETDIKLTLNLDGSGKSKIKTGIEFLDHMLVLFAKHGLFDLDIRAKGDIGVDYHHTFEDIGICLGAAFNAALGRRISIARFGSVAVPMDEVLTKVEAAIDISGRPYLSLNGADKYLRGAKKGKFKFRRKTDIYFTREFLKGLVNNAKITLHVDILSSGEIHHINESIFKAVAVALRKAVAIEKRSKGVSSTKGKI